MRKLSFKSLLKATAAGLLAVSTTGAVAEDPGVIRISDGKAVEATTQSHCPCGSPGCDGCQVGYEVSRRNGRKYNSGRNGGNRKPSLVGIWLDPDSTASTYSPDHGWARPVKFPIHRVPVDYLRRWPANWYGLPGGGITPGAPIFPTVYMPTDTTQLGYYYQRVPQWRPNPAMLPPAPWPSLWHRRECPGLAASQAYGRYGRNGQYGAPVAVGVDGPPPPADHGPVPKKDEAEDAAESDNAPPEAVEELDRSASTPKPLQLR